MKLSDRSTIKQKSSVIQQNILHICNLYTILNITQYSVHKVWVRKFFFIAIYIYRNGWRSIGQIHVPLHETFLTSPPPIYVNCLKLKNKLHRDCINQLIMKIRIIYNTTQWIKIKKIYKVYIESSHDLMIKKSYIKKMSEKSSRKSPLHVNFFSIKYIVYEYILFNTECTLFILCLSHIHKINMENLTSIWFTNCYN